ncbi:MAG: Crp/Fnr family transcriptional regulator [Selenomonadales bacterium]|jgi:CRP-like cAMP-binding protein|nr:Crp/Fnr family transcriptional regulator [Selenomonadales bacterium]
MLQLREVSIIKALPADVLDACLQDGSIRSVCYEKDAVIHFEGDRCDSLEVVVKGSVMIERIDEEGNLLTIAEFSSGDIIGGNLMFSKDPHYPFAVSAKTVVELVRFSKERTFVLCSQSPYFLECYLECVSSHALTLGDKIKHHVRRTIRERITAYLANEVKRQGSCHIKLSLTKKALAERIGAQRTSLSRELQRMKLDGLIDYNATHVVCQKIWRETP